MWKAKGKGKAETEARRRVKTRGKGKGKVEVGKVKKWFSAGGACTFQHVDGLFCSDCLCG